jgi:hypothetical protein
MDILPTHNNLNKVVKPGNVNIPFDFDTSVNHRRNIQKIDRSEGLQFLGEISSLVWLSFLKELHFFKLVKKTLAPHFLMHSCGGKWLSIYPTFLLKYYKLLHPVISIITLIGHIFSKIKFNKI